jgi:hypothetical protein
MLDSVEDGGIGVRGHAEGLADVGVDRAWLRRQAFI